MYFVDYGRILNDIKNKEENDEQTKIPLGNSLNANEIQSSKKFTYDLLDQNANDNYLLCPIKLLLKLRPSFEFFESIDPTKNSQKRYLCEIKIEQKSFKRFCPTNNKAIKGCAILVLKQLYPEVYQKFKEQKEPDNTDAVNQNKDTEQNENLKNSKKRTFDRCVSENNNEKVIKISNECLERQKRMRQEEITQNTTNEVTEQQTLDIVSPIFKKNTCVNLSQPETKQQSLNEVAIKISTEKTLDSSRQAYATLLRNKITQRAITKMKSQTILTSIETVKILFEKLKQLMPSINSKIKIKTIEKLVKNEFKENSEINQSYVQVLISLYKSINRVWSIHGRNPEMIKLNILSLLFGYLNKHRIHPELIADYIIALSDAIKAKTKNINLIQDLIHRLNKLVTIIQINEFKEIIYQENLLPVLINILENSKISIKTYECCVDLLLKLNDNIMIRGYLRRNQETLVKSHFY